MNLILLVMAGGLVFVAAYMANTWVTSHALAVAAGDQWAIQASGWPALWPVLAVGLLVGAAAGLALGLVLSGKLADALADKRTDAAKEAEKALQAQRLDLARERAGIDQKIQQVADERIKSIKEWAEKTALENEKNKDEILRLQRKTGIIEGRMKGAQQKAARIKKAQLMRV